MDKFDGLDEAFETVSEISKVEPSKPAPPPKVKDQVDDDHEYSRAQLYNLIEKGQEAISGALDVAMSSDHPRAYTLFPYTTLFRSDRKSVV